MSKDTHGRLSSRNKNNATVVFAKRRNPHSFYRWSTIHFLLQKKSTYKHSMSVKKHLHRFSKLYSICKEIIESFSNQTGVISITKLERISNLIKGYFESMKVPTKTTSQSNCSDFWLKNPAMIKFWESSLIN